MTLPTTRTPALPDAPVESITALTQELVRTPSRGGVDDYGPVVELLVARTAHGLGLAPWVLTDAWRPVAVACDVVGDRPGPRYVLDACLDTAGIGDPDAWTRDPFSGDIDGGWLHGRGTADSKAAVSVFCHLAADLARHRDFAGTLSLLFDLDEHTGGFAGIRRYLDRTPNVAGVLIGYPGTDRIVTGARGYWRGIITVHGEAAHTGATTRRGVNAVDRAARLVTLIHDLDAFAGAAEGFPHPPKMTVTGVRAGEAGSWSVVPDRAEVHVDVRLTPTFEAGDAADLLRALCLELDETDPDTLHPTTVEAAGDSWPAYQLAADHPLPAALLAGARTVGLNPRLGPAGPSNIGCMLASRSIPATAGFGAAYRGLHAADEAIDLASLPAVFGAYRAAVLTLLG